MTSLQGKTALVTGSTSGIGLGIAQALAQAGSNIILNGFGQTDDIEDIRAKIEKDFNVRAIYHGANMLKGKEISALFKNVGQDVDILVNNAGIQYVAPIDEFPEDKWQDIISLNLTSSFHTIKAALPRMKRQNWGRIINLASAHGLVASPFKSAYVAAKHGLVGLTKTVALEIAETNITCNAICPGYVKTPLVEGQIKDQAIAHNMSHEEVIRNVILAAQPNKRFVEVEEIGEITAFLCSDAAKSINGISLPVEGGWTAR